MDFIVNFGVKTETKNKIIGFFESGVTPVDLVAELQKVEYLELLKLHKYFYWADKKLHSVFYMEDKDKITEDLLIEFK